MELLSKGISVWHFRAQNEGGSLIPSFPPPCTTPTPPMPLVLSLHPFAFRVLFLIVGKLCSDWYIPHMRWDICGKYNSIAWFQEAHLKSLLSDSCLSETFNSDWKHTGKNNFSYLACLNCRLLIAPLLGVTSSSKGDSWNWLKTSITNCHMKNHIIERWQTISLIEFNNLQLILPHHWCKVLGFI